METKIKTEKCAKCQDKPRRQFDTMCAECREKDLNPMWLHIIETRKNVTPELLEKVLVTIAPVAEIIRIRYGRHDDIVTKKPKGK